MNFVHESHKKGNILALPQHLENLNQQTPNYYITPNFKHEF
jgi:hypothetical protein